jgi:protoporphyrinogen oxidase
MKIAIIGGGVSGLVTAYLLSDEHDITLFEANDYLGGHTHTVDSRPPSPELARKCLGVVTIPAFSKAETKETPISEARNGSSP